MIFEKFNPAIPLVEDGFSIEAANSQTKKKNQLIRHFIKVYTGTMKRKFNYLVFVDLFSGSGIKKLKENEILSGSPALSLENKGAFSKYIFCEKDKQLYDALKIRTNKYCKDENVALFNDEPNSLVEKLSYYIPESSRNYNVSTLCLVDMLSMDIEFETIKLLSELGVNFLLLFGLSWTSKSQFESSLDIEREQINSFLGVPWSVYEKRVNVTSNESFFRNIVKIYHQNLRSLGYISQGSFHKIENSEFDIDIFFSGYYSHTTNTRKIHSEVVKSITPQVSLFE